MKEYTTREVAELLDLSPAKIRAFARAGFLLARRDHRRHYHFSFRDIVLLRTAKELDAASMHPRKIWRALRSLKSQLPKEQSLTSMRIAVEGDRIVASDRDTTWQPESGQVILDFSVSELAHQVAPLVREAAQATSQAEGADSNEWFELGNEFELVLESDDAKQAYARAVALDPNHGDAHINLGHMLHADGNLREAEQHYRLAIIADPDDAIAYFNLGVVLEDIGRRTEEAVQAYTAAIRADPTLADAHYNLASIYEESGKRPAALRHLARYRALTK